MTRPILQVAAKALIVNPAGQVLIAREAPSGANNVKTGQYGLISGRLNPGEPFFEGLRREVHEETGLTVIPEYPLQVGEWNPLIRGVPHQIIAIFMLCKAKNTTIKLSSEHDDFQWINPAGRHDYPMMEPDCYVVDRYRSIADV